MTVDMQWGKWWWWWWWFFLLCNVSEMDAGDCVSGLTLKMANVQSVLMDVCIVQDSDIY